MDYNKTQKEIAKFCKMWGLKCNHKKKTNVIVFKKGVKLKKNERGHKGGYNLEVVSEITYFGVKLEV